MSKEVFWYEYKREGMAPGNQPGGFVNQETDRGEFGRIAYNRELTKEEISKYKLSPVT